MIIGNQFVKTEVISAKCPKCNGTDGYPNLKYRFALLCRTCDATMIVKGKQKMTLTGWVFAAFVFVIVFGVFMSLFFSIVG